MATSTNCNKCGRPMVYAKENKCNYCDSCMSEYCGCKLGRIKEMEPTCDSTAVIPSITVESVEGITNLANCLVHVEDINTTFYVDDKHRVMITWAGPVNIPGYDMENNPNGYRDQIVTDIEKGIAVIYDKHGKGYTFGIYDSLDSDGAVTQAINDKLDEMAANGTLEEIISDYIGEPIFGFDTVADMKAATNLTTGDYVKTLGFYSINDGGGAVYKITNSGPANEADVVAVGSLFAHLINGKNVRQFGAKGDGNTNDSIKFKAAIAYSPIIDIPAGDYIVNLSGETYTNLKLTGEGDTSKLIFEQPIDCIKLEANQLQITAAQSVASLINISNNTKRYISLTDCLFDGNGTVTNGINGDSSSIVGEVKINNCRFTAFKENAIKLMGNGDLFECHNSSFTSLGNATSTNTRGVSLGSTTNTAVLYDRVIIADCLFDTLTSADSIGSESAECQAIRVRANEAFINHNTVRNMLGKGQDHEGIYLKGNKAEIIGNILSNCGHGNGAITIKPVNHAVISNNIISGDGCCIFARGTNVLVENNNLTSDFTGRTNYASDDGASWHVTCLSEGYVDFGNNTIVGINSQIVSDTTGLIKCEYDGHFIHNNVMRTTYFNYVLSITNSIAKTIDFVGNVLTLSNNNGIFRINDYRSGLVLNVDSNKIYGSYGEIVSGASNMTSYTCEFNFTKNEVDLTNCTAASNIIAVSNINVASIFRISKNNFYATGAVSFTAFYVVYCNSYIIDNDVSTIGLTRALLVAKGVDIIDVERNNIGGALMRMNAAVTCTTVKVIGNFSTGSIMFQTNVLTATTAYVLNNTCAYTPDTSTYLSATTLYDKGNVNYTI